MSIYAHKNSVPHAWTPTKCQKPLTSQECARIQHEVEFLELSGDFTNERELLIQYHVVVKRLSLRIPSGIKPAICSHCHLFCKTAPKCKTCGAETCCVCRKLFDKAPNIKYCPVCSIACTTCHKCTHKSQDGSEVCDCTDL